MQQSKAFLFDLNGTMIDDLPFHIKSWFELLNVELKANLTLEEIKSQIYGKNIDVFKRIFGEDRFTEEELQKLSLRKAELYQQIFRPHLKLIPGLDELLKQAYENKIPMAIGTNAVPSSVNFVVDNLNIRHYFGAIVKADDITQGKPHPETFTKAADLLNVDYKDCLVFEDVPQGVESAKNAGMKCVVILTMHKKEDFAEFDNVLFFVKDYTDSNLLEYLGFLKKENVDS